MKTRINFYLDEDVKKKLEELAASHRRSLSQMIEVLVLKAAFDGLAESFIDQTDERKSQNEANLEKNLKTLRQYFPSDSIKVEVSEKINSVKEEPLPYGKSPDPILDFMKRIESEMASVKGQISELKSKKKK